MIQRSTNLNQVPQWSFVVRMEATFTFMRYWTLCGWVAASWRALYAAAWLQLGLSSHIRFVGVLHLVWRQKL